MNSYNYLPFQHNGPIAIMFNACLRRKSKKICKYNEINENSFLIDKLCYVINNFHAEYSCRELKFFVLTNISNASEINSLRYIIVDSY